ncbi:MAG: oligoendopeptidase F [Thermoguttaceae bacterium]
MKSTRRSFIKTTGLLAAASIVNRTANENHGGIAAASESPSEKFSPEKFSSEKYSPENIMSAKTIPTRQEIPVADTWNLDSLFQNDADWKSMLEELRPKLIGFKPFEGKLVDPALVLACFRYHDEISMQTERIIVYASLRFSENVADSTTQEMKGISDTFWSQFREATSFIDPELIALPENHWNALLVDPRLELYRLKLERLGRERAHTLSKEEERLLAMLSETSQTASKAFGLLNNADLKFGTIQDESGQNVELSTGSFVVLMNSPNREIRKKAFHQFYAGYQSHENTLASLLSSSISQDVIHAKIRNYPSALDAALFRSEIPKKTYNNLVGSIRAALPSLHRYYELRRRKMGIDSIHMYDIYIPILSDIQTDYSWETGVKTIADAMKPLGDEYVSVMTNGLTTARWSDRYENKGKRSGAFSYGTFLGNPYILMNYKTNVIDSLFTLAHEAGHSMHSYYSAKTQSYTYYDYVTFLAEVASTFNEDLLARHLLNKAEDDRMRAWLINRQLDAIRQTIFRQTMFAEFEQQTHEMVESGESLTAKSIQNTYRKLLDDYFGPRFLVDDNLATESLRVPHFYRAFYVFQYATGMSAALALSERVISGGETERNDYLTFLRGGCSASPIELLRTAGVDMESPAPIDAAMKRFSDLLDELERLIV